MTQEGKDLLETLYAGVEKMTTSDDWKAALDQAAKFHSYSFRNTLLILLQTNGTATRVAGYKKWQEFGRQVKKGEKSLRILAPVIVTVKDPSDPRFGEKVCVGFKGCGVFDVSQTEGEDLLETPRPKLLEGEAPEGALDAVVALIEGLGFSFGYGPSQAGENGFTDFLGKRVQVTEGLSAAQTLKTAIHEYAHAKLHGTSDDELGADARHHRGMAEVQADSAAYVACGILGLDASDYSFAYVAGWSGGDAKAVLKMADGALKVAHEVAEAVPALEAVAA